MTSKIPARPSPPTGEKQPLHGTGLCTTKQFLRAAVISQPFYNPKVNLSEYKSYRRGYSPIPYGETVIKEGKIGEATVHVNLSREPALSWHLDHRTLSERKGYKVKSG